MTPEIYDIALSTGGLLLGGIALWGLARLTKPEPIDSAALRELMRKVPGKRPYYTDVGRPAWGTVYIMAIEGRGDIVKVGVTSRKNNGRRNSVGANFRAASGDANAKARYLFRIHCPHAKTIEARFHVFHQRTPIQHPDRSLGTEFYRAEHLDYIRSQLLRITEQVVAESRQAGLWETSWKPGIQIGDRARQAL